MLISIPMMQVLVNSLTFAPWVCWKRGVYLGKVDKNYTSQICPNFGTKTGKKELPQRIHKMWARN